MLNHFFGGGVNKFVEEFEDVLQLAGFINRKTSAEKGKQDDQEQDDQNFADEPIGPGMRRIVVIVNGVEERVGRSGQGAVEESGNPEFGFHLMRRATYKEVLQQFDDC